MSTTNVNIGTGSGGAGQSTITLLAAINLSTDAATAADFSVYNANSPCTPQVLNLISGANTISSTNCPALAQSGAVMLIPPSGNIVTLTLKGISADTGVALGLTAPTLITFPVSPPSSFVITTNNTITGFTLLWL